MREAVTLEAADADPDGWQRLRLNVDWPEEVPGRLVSLGGAAEILEPADVRNRAVELARRLIERHASVS